MVFIFIKAYKDRCGAKGKVNRSTAMMSHVRKMAEKDL